MTHAYFCFYHALANMVLRRTAYAVQHSPRICQWLTLGTVVFVLAYITALMETVTIAHFPYYRFKVRHLASLCIVYNLCGCCPVLDSVQLLSYHALLLTHNIHINGLLLACATTTACKMDKCNSFEQDSFACCACRTAPKCIHGDQSFMPYTFGSASQSSLPWMRSHAKFGRCGKPPGILWPQEWV